VLLAMHQMALGLFRLLASVARVMIVAQTGGSFAIIVVFVLGGFIVSRGTSFQFLYNNVVLNADVSQFMIIYFSQLLKAVPALLVGHLA
jgi:hypothetical protein